MPIERPGPSDTSWLFSPCPELSRVHTAAAGLRQSILTKPPGALGILEHIAIQLAGLQSSEKPCADDAAIVLFAGDHGVTAQGVSAFPSSVTVEMLRNFTAGGAAISVLARQTGSDLTVVDAGTLADRPLPGVLTDKPCRGTRDFTVEPAMTPGECAHAFAAGHRAVARVLATPPNVLILGEMGIGNTTSASAFAAALLCRAPADIVGAGTGLDQAGMTHKSTVVARGLEQHGLKAGPAPPLEIMACVGGLEIAALTGAIIAAAQARLPVLVDGFIVSVAALAAVRINPACRPWLMFSHRSAEQGHRIVLDALDAEPILDLALRLGEGSGAAIALPVVRLACALHNEMATFEEAKVSNRDV